MYDLTWAEVWLEKGWGCMIQGLTACCCQGMAHRNAGFPYHGWPSDGLGASRTPSVRSPASFFQIGTRTMSCECEAEFTASAKGERAIGGSDGEMMFFWSDDELKESMG